MQYEKNYDDDKLKIKEIEEISKILSDNFKIDYNADGSKPLEYYIKTKEFFNEDIISDIKLAYERLANKKTGLGKPHHYILIDGENIFYHKHPNHIDRFLLSLIVSYNYPYIIIFCQEHSLHTKLKNLNNFLIINSSYDINIFSDSSDKKKLKLLGKKIFDNPKDEELDKKLQTALHEDVDPPPSVPSHTECDDILFLTCYAFLKDKNMDVKVLTNDNMRWTNKVTIDPNDKLTDHIQFFSDLENENKVVAIKTQKTSKRYHPRYHPYKIEKKSKGKKQRTRTKPKPKKQRTRTKPKPKKQRTITKPKNKLHIRRSPP